MYFLVLFLYYSVAVLRFCGIIPISAAVLIVFSELQSHCGPAHPFQDAERVYILNQQEGASYVSAAV